MMYGYDDGWGTGGWVLMSLLMLAFSALIILAVIALLRSTRANPPPTPAADRRGQRLRCAPSAGVSPTARSTNRPHQKAGTADVPMKPPTRVPSPNPQDSICHDPPTTPSPTEDRGLIVQLPQRQASPCQGL
jgi:hypothetical protein